MHCHELFDWLVDQGKLGGEWNVNLSDPLRLMTEALRVKNDYALAVLLDHGHDAAATDSEDYGMLHRARTSRAVDMLVSHGADPNRINRNWRPIDGAAIGAEVVEALYPLTDNPSTAIFRAINLAAFSKWKTPEDHAYDMVRALETLEILKDHGADIDHPRPYGLSGAPADAISAVEYARKYRDDGVDPAVIAFIEDWAKDQSADGPGKQDDQ